MSSSSVASSTMPSELSRASMARSMDTGVADLDGRGKGLGRLDGLVLVPAVLVGCVEGVGVVGLHAPCMLQASALLPQLRASRYGHRSAPWTAQPMVQQQVHRMQEPGTGSRHSATAQARPSLSPLATPRWQQARKARPKKQLTGPTWAQTRRGMRSTRPRSLHILKPL